MFLLLLMGLGAAGVKAQVRIGGNTPPNPAAALDLNANDDATPAGNKGALALPRVSLASTTAQLNGATPITGMLVYNTNTALGVGVYYWDGSKWVNMNYNYFIGRDSIIGLGTAAPGARLEYNGSAWIIVRPDTLIGFTLNCTTCPNTPTGTTLSQTITFPQGCSPTNTWSTAFTFPQNYVWTYVPGNNYAQIYVLAQSTVATNLSLKCLARN